jgi:hypothetical protein
MKTVRVRCNPRCVKCARYARMHQRLDWLGRVEDSTASPLPRRSLRMGEVLVEDLRDGSLHAGAAGMRLLFRQVPAYWLCCRCSRCPDSGAASTPIPPAPAAMTA